ncbi:MAG: ferredoxin [Candidatus Binatia bacterium]
MPRPVRHFFVCHNRRPPLAQGSSCGANGADDLVFSLRAERERRGLSASVFITATACLGPCPAEGATVVVYPEGTWYRAVTGADVEEIAESHMARGEVVRRLVDPDFESET